MTERELAILTADLIKHRHRIAEHQIVDCLDIATIWKGPRVIITAQQLMDHWGVCRSVVSHRMQRLRRAGLIDYDRGYQIWQLGPGLCDTAT